MPDQYIAAVRKEGFPAYAIKPGGERDILAPVVFIEPFTGRNLRAFGFDTFAEPQRHAAMEMARDTGDVVITGKMQLILDDGRDKQPGFLMYLPVYKYGAPHGTADERRANIIGWIDFVSRSQDLMTGILGERPVEAGIKIFDGTEASQDMLIYDSAWGNRKPMAGPERAMFKKK